MQWCSNHLHYDFIPPEKEWKLRQIFARCNDDEDLGKMSPDDLIRDMKEGDYAGREIGERFFIPNLGESLKVQDPLPPPRPPPFGY